MKNYGYLIMFTLFVFIAAVGLVGCVTSPSEASTTEDVSKDVSSESSEPSDVDESTVSEHSGASKVEESLTGSSEPSVADVSEPPSDESSEHSETSKVEEPSHPDEPSEPEDTSTTPSEVVKPNEDSKVEETSKDEISKNATSKEETVIQGDTPVEIVVDGKQETVTSYEEAKELLALEDLENADVIVLELRSGTRTFTANGDGTFVCSTTLRTYTAQKVYDFYICQWCSDCGKRVGHGDNGTCVRYLIDTECTYCGEFCKGLECHTCNEPDEEKPTYETFSGTVSVYNAHNLAYTDWQGDTQQAAFIEVYTVEKSDDVLNALAVEFENVYGFAPNLGNRFSCITSCENLGVFIVEGYAEPQNVYHYTITDKTYIYITNNMYEVYVQQCDDGSVWVGFCIYATMDTINDERSKNEVKALEKQMRETFSELIGINWNEMRAYKDELELKICCISEAGTVRSIHSDGLVDVLYIHCRGLPLTNG